MIERLQEISIQFSVDVERIESSNSNIMECANKSIILCRTTLNALNKLIQSKGFEKLEHEVKFFKNIKPISFIPLIYYSEVRSFEIQFPKTNLNDQRKTIRKKIKKLNRFFLYNMDFGQYVDSGSTHFDKEYYTRKYLDSYPIPTSKFYFQDPDFSTPRDMLLAKFKAYQKFIGYLERKSLKLKNYPKRNTLPSSENKLQWPFSNTDYVELLYALCLRGLGKQDKKSMMKVSQSLQQVIDYQPKDIYKTFQDIKGRKNSRTLFLDELSKTLLIEIEKSEE